MTSDTFAQFVEVLAETLDEPHTRGDAFARRLHLSRFHLDRLVSATAGEPPAALRRRVLLERAAHRLLTTNDELLAVAIDAGYSSHEAFTRAFRRAYDETPSTWRLRARRFQIDAPNGVHFHPPGGLRLRADREVTEMELITKMSEHHVWLLGELITAAQTIPEEALDARIEVSVDALDSETNLRGLLSHLVGELEMWTAAVEGHPYSFPDPGCLGSIRTRLEGAGPAFLELIRSAIAEGRLDETFVDAVCDPPEVFTYGGMIAHVLTFSAYRRTLAIGALASAGNTTLGYGDPMRYVAA